MYRQIEERAVLVIARRQPMAQDLRETIAAIRIVSDLERIADLGKNIARRALAIQTPVLLAEGAGRRRASRRARPAAGQGRARRLSRRATSPRLGTSAKRDEEIDAVYTSLFRQLLTYMMEDPRNISMCTHLLFCAKNIERIGDHATNIAETVFYLITGEQWTGQRQSSTRTAV